MQKEEQLLQKRLIELSKYAFHRNIVTFTDFLNLNEINILHTLPKNELYTEYRLNGGYDLAERQMVAFLPDALYYETEFPFQMCKITICNKRFAEKLSHRDYLGAILNLGIDRCKVGDIIISEQDAIVYISNSIINYVCQELTRIRHTTVIASTITKLDFQFEPNFQEIKGTVASIRLDSLLALAFSSSRSRLVQLIENGKVYVNGKIITTNSYQPKENDVISARGLGKFRYIKTLSTTKKDRFYIQINKYD